MLEEVARCIGGGHFPMMRTHSVLVLFLATPLAAQPPRQVTADDYARAEKYLSPTAARLVARKTRLIY